MLPDSLSTSARSNRSNCATVGARPDSSEARSDQIGASIRVNAGPLIDGLAKSGQHRREWLLPDGGHYLEWNFRRRSPPGETLRRTSLGEMKPGTLVNLERPLTRD